jgi:heme/copper-type cytochrome/quinol oxidase subunit 2
VKFRFHLAVVKSNISFPVLAIKFRCKLAHFGQTNLYITCFKLALNNMGFAKLLIKIVLVPVVFIIVVVLVAYFIKSKHHRNKIEKSHGPPASMPWSINSRLSVMPTAVPNVAYQQGVVDLERGQAWQQPGKGMEIVKVSLLERIPKQSS